MGHKDRSVPFYAKIPVKSALFHRRKMTKLLASTMLASAEANQIELAIAKIKAKNAEDYDKHIELATFAIKHLEAMINDPATEENILKAKQAVFMAAVEKGASVFDEESVAETLLAGAITGAASSVTKMMVKNIKGGGVEGMIKRFELNASASLEARSGTLTIGKLLELQPSVFIPSLA